MDGVTLLDAIAADPTAFDPLQANAGHGGCFRGGLCLGASALSLARLFADERLQEELKELGALDQAATDETAVGWLLCGGACKWTAGGLQALELRRSGPLAMFAAQKHGYGLVSGFGSCVMHFPDLAEGGITVAVTVNDVLRGREAAAILLKDIFSTYGYAPAWLSIPAAAVLLDAAKLARTEPAASLLKSAGGIQGIFASGSTPTQETRRAPHVRQASGKYELLPSQARWVKLKNIVAKLGACCTCFCATGQSSKHI